MTLSFADAGELLSRLHDSNSWVQSTATRLLMERRAADTENELRRLVQFGETASVQLAAIRILHASDLLRPVDLSEGLRRQRASSVRTAATILLLHRLAGAERVGVYVPMLERLAVDSSLEIRTRAASGLAGVSDPATATALAGVFSRDGDEVWIQRVMLTVSPEGMVPLLTTLLREPSIWQSREGVRLLMDLAVGIGLGSDLNDVSACMTLLGDRTDSVAQTLPVLDALGQGMAGRGLRLSDTDDDRTWLLTANAVQSIATDSPDPLLRANAVKVLGAFLGPDFVADEFLLLMFAPGLPEVVQIPVIQALGRQGLDRDFRALTQRWQFWAAPQQRATLDVLLEWDDGARELLRALEDRSIPRQALTSTHRNLLRDHPAQDVKNRAIRLLGGRGSRDDVLRKYLEAADLQGDAGLGRDLFARKCIYCHGNSALGPGPALGTLDEESSLQRLADILDPSRDIASSHETVLFRLRDTRLVWGVIRDSTGPVIVLATPNGAQRYVRASIVSTEQVDWSLMPEEAAEGLTRQQIADIVEFIRQGGGAVSSRE
jgi:putative heme-binding domain-containing protein